MIDAVTAAGDPAIAMTGFVTVFEISRWSNGLLADELFRLGVGVSALIGGVGGAIRALRKDKGRSRGELVPCLFLTAWAVFWLMLHNFPRMYGHIDALAAAYRHHRYEVVEGPVTVLHEQPEHGHASGDRIVVGGKTFEVNFFYATPGYRQTISHGGVLRAGAYARLGYVGEDIVRVEIRKR